MKVYFLGENVFPHGGKGVEVSVSDNTKRAQLDYIWDRMAFEWCKSAQPFSRNALDRQTDRQTDGQTDISHLSSLPKARSTKVSENKFHSNRNIIVEVHCLG